jgi:hypothetical protein
MTETLLLYQRAKQQAKDGNFLEAARTYRQLAEIAVELPRKRRALFISSLQTQDRTLVFLMSR